tara:strand:+ start:22 stop:552 length:531 start_codon:yes stop_codon:yes gene_type:complete
MDIISEKYLLEQKELHKNPDYGVASLTFAPIVAKICKENKINSICDYGAGKKRLLDALKKENINTFKYFPYDPVFKEYGEAKEADLVCCIDVLEHIEPKFVDNTIDKLFEITMKIGFFSIHLGPASKTLSNGKNAHLIQKPTSWWLLKLCKYFDILHLQKHNSHGVGFWVIVTPIK